MAFAELVDAPWRDITNTPAEYVWALVCGLNPQHGRYRSVLVLSQGFIDDSGSGGDSPYFVLSSLISTVEKWATFSNAWQIALQEQPSVEYFKMSEAESLKGQFSNFNSQQRDAKVSRLTDLVVQYTEFRFSHLVDADAFNEILRPVLPKPFRNAYLWAFNGMVSGLASYQQHGSEHKDQIECVFDRQGKLEKRAGRLYDKLRGRSGFQNHHLIREPIRFENDKTFLPLQGADLLAWHVRRYHSIVDEPIRETLRILTKSGQGKYHEFVVGPELLSKVAQTVGRAWKTNKR